MQAVGWLRRGSAEIVAWLLPLIVVAEYVGTTYGNTVAATIGMLALFAGVLFVAPEEHSPKSWPRWLVWTGRGLGLALLAAGAVGMWQALTPILDPLHHRPPPLPTLRHREAFLLAPIPWAYAAALGFSLLEGRTSGRHLERLGLLIALVLLAHLVGKQRVQGLGVLPYHRAGIDSLTVSATVVLVTLLFVPRVPAVVRMLALLGAGLALRWVGLESWKPDPAVRDMLPLVQSAQDAFFSGDNPYSLHQMQRGSVVPLTYLPGMWLLWAVPRLVGADFRVMGLVADAAVVGGLFWAASGVSKKLRGRAQGIAVGFGAVWLFSPSLAWNGIYAEPHAWWLVLAVLIAATLRQRWWLAAGALGVALATRHFAAVVAPFVLLAMLRELGWRRMLPRLALTGTITALLLVPFVARDPETFWFGTFRWLVEYGPVHQSWFWEKFGFSGPLYKAKLHEWMPRAQVVLPLSLLIVAAFSRGPRRYVAPAGLAYVLFVMFNGIIWDSFYLGASLFAAFAAAGGHALATVPRVKVPTRRGLIASGLLVSGAAVAAAWLVWTLAVSQSHTGRDALRAELGRQLTPASALVDRTDWNLAFVKGEPLFSSTPAPAAWGRNLFDPALGPNGAFGRPSALMARRAGLDAELVEELRAAGLVQSESSFGRYRLLSLSGLSIQQRLGTLPGAYVPRPCSIGGMQRQMAGPRDTSGKRQRMAFSGVKLGRALVLFGGTDDRLITWGRGESFARLLVNGQPAARLRIPNLPGMHVSVVSTTRFGAGPHELEILVSSKQGASSSVCVDGFVLE